MKIRVFETTQPVDLNVVRDTQHKIAELRKITKSLKKSSLGSEVVTSKLADLRKQRQNLTTMVFMVTVNNRRFNYYEIFTEMPKASDIRGAKVEFCKRVKTARAEAKKQTVECREVVGFKYNVIGGVMQLPGTIKHLMNNTDPMTRIRANKKPISSSKENFVGIEIELVAKCTKESLEYQLIKSGLAGKVQVKSDSSISREMPDEYCHEIVILSRQGDLKEIFVRLSEVLKLPFVSAYVNNSCGLHIHIDCRNRDHKKVYKNLVNTIPILTGMVPSDRVTGDAANRYCQRNTSNDYDIAVGGGNRYQVINPVAYQKYGTIEVRIHSGTTNATKIINWATLLIAIADATNIETTVSSITKLKELLNLSPKLVDYIERRTKLFTEKQIKDTREDHFNTLTYEMAV